MEATVIRPNQPPQVEEIISNALAIVGRLEIDGDLKAVAFVETVKLLGAVAVFPMPSPVGLNGLQIAGPRL
jgi:hypothetical protein